MKKISPFALAICLKVAFLEFQSESMQLCLADLKAGVRFIFHGKPLPQKIPANVKAALEYFKNLQKIYQFNTVGELCAFLKEFSTCSDKFITQYQEGDLLKKIAIEQQLKAVYRIDPSGVACAPRRSYFDSMAAEMETTTNQKQQQSNAVVSKRHVVQEAV